MVTIPLMQVKRYTSTNPNGTTVTAIVQGRSVGIRVRGAATMGLATAENYATVGTIKQIGDLLTKGQILKRIVITKSIFGQLIITTDGVIRVGYTFDSAGAAVNIPEGMTFYIEESLVMQ